MLIIVKLISKPVLIGAVFAAATAKNLRFEPVWQII